MREDPSEIAADISQREPDFYGRNDAPIWCVGEPTVEDLAHLLQAEGGLAPSSQRAHDLMESAYRKARRAR